MSTKKLINPPKPRADSQQNKLVCCKCGEDLKDDNFNHEGELYCERCFEGIFFECASCGNIENLENSHTGTDDELYCESCFDENFSYCDYCGELCINDESYWCGNERICQGCYESHYFTCEGCGEIFHLNDEAGNCYCQNCYSENNNTSGDSEPDDKQYYTKSRRDLAVGVEIEAEGGCYDDVHYDLRDEGFGVCEDGSLSNNGIEVQIPASNQGNTQKLVERACSSLTACGYSPTKSCGVHIHIEYPCQFKTFKKLFLTAYAIDPLLFACQPKSRQENTYCIPLKKDFSFQEILNTPTGEIDGLYYQKKNGDNANKKKFLKQAKKEKYNSARYYGVNLHSIFYHRTIEFRHHAGTTESVKILNWIDLLKKVLLYVRFKYDFNQVSYLLQIPSNIGKLNYLSQIIGLDKNIQEYFKSRILKFAYSNRQAGFSVV